MRILTILLTITILFACGEKEHHENMSEISEYAYVCPMHPQIIQNKQGNCPICGMNLIKQEIKSSLLEDKYKHSDDKYVCPMHSNIVKDEPGNCPICGMKLVKKNIGHKKNSKTTHEDKYPTVTVSPEIVQRMGIRTTTIKKENLQRKIQTIGYVTYNEDKMIHIHPRSRGWVEKLSVKREGDWVKRGQKLLEMYSPEVLEAQQDFLVALRTQFKGNKLNRQEYRNVIRNRLRLLGVSDSTIKHIERQNTSINNIPMFAPQSGTVMYLNIREGMYVTPSLEMFTIVDLSTIWVIVEIFEHQLNWVQEGLKADIEVPALPDKIWKGKVDYIYPTLDPKIRTLKVRLRFDNPKGLLKLNMFTQATIYGKPKGNVLTIPQQALITTGERESVIKVLSNGKFKPIDVKTGMRSQGKLEILSGLKTGDKIVLSGQFLIDSEANLQASFLRFGEIEQQNLTGHQH